mmetsp:Transcript_21432/g.42055  ORF Transcript_21432/g.42055 Transcript_21432/m.42055 type:complete len:323 (-) Transcript_21432:201-1169(-)
MLQLKVRAVTMADVSSLRSRCSESLSHALGDNAMIASMFANVAMMVFVLWWVQRPLDPQLFQTLSGAALLAFIYKRDSSSAAKREALGQMRRAISHFVQVEADLFREARAFRNDVASEVNLVQQLIDDERGFFYSWTSFWRREPILRDTSLYEGAALQTTSALATLLNGPVADRLVQTRGFGPVVFVCLPKNAPSIEKSQKSVRNSFRDSLPMTLLVGTEKPRHVRVFGVYFFGTLITRFSAASAVLAMFPETLESPRLRRVRNESRRLVAVLREREEELQRVVMAKFGIQNQKMQNKKEIKQVKKTIGDADVAKAGSKKLA